MPAVIRQDRIPFSASLGNGRPIALWLIETGLRRGLVLGGLLLAAVLSSELLSPRPIAAAESVPWPMLPAENARIEIPAQEWPLRPGARTVRLLIHYPAGQRAKVTKETGLMLSLHNWGGEDCVGTAHPQTLADRFNLVVLCVNYLQSGAKDSIEGPEPYDFGVLQATDALRGLWFLFHGLDQAGIPFHKGRIYATGGSGGGNVTLMSNKLAPRTFAGVIDLCGMKKLSADIAFNLPGGSNLNARWQRDPKHPYYLSVDDQELRFVGHPLHLARQRELGSRSRILIVHGVDDRTCPFEDATELAANLKQAGLDVIPHWIDKTRIDGQAFTTTGHSLGNRTEIVIRVAGDWLLPDSETRLIRTGPTDFELADEQVRYATTNGAYIVSYKQGYPVLRFERRPTPTDDPLRLPLLTQVVPDESNPNGAAAVRPIKTWAEWEQRAKNLRRHFERVTGPLPAETARVPLNAVTLSEERVDGMIRSKVRYQSDEFDAVTAWLLIPTGQAGDAAKDRRPAMLCLHQTTSAGKDEPAGLSGSANLQYARELVARGYVALVPDSPSFGEHPYDFAAHPEYVSGSMKAIWDNVRSVDLLCTLPEVDPARIGVIGHSLGGHHAIFTAVFEPRLKVVISSCGFSRMTRDDVPSWTGPRYLPRIATEFGNEAARLPFDFPGLIACLAPRAVFVSAADKDDDFDLQGVQETIELVQPVYRLAGAESKLKLVAPAGPHDFPPAARQQAYEFLDQQLMSVRK